MVCTNEIIEIRILNMTEAKAICWRELIREAFLKSQHHPQKTFPRVKVVHYHRWAHFTYNLPLVVTFTFAHLELISFRLTFFHKGSCI